MVQRVLSVFYTRLVLLFLLLTLVPAYQVAAVPVSWDTGEDTAWQVLSSDNFEIFYRDENQVMAQQSLQIAEQVHRELVPFFTDDQGQVTLPPEPTRIVLVDDFDTSNGWATPFPFAQIRLYASPPQDLNGLETIGDWLPGLIRHEYVHVLHTEMASGVTQTSRDILGRTPLLPVIIPLSPFPHSLAPPMLLEGLAVYLETNKEQGYGRLQSNFYQMLMRTEVASGELMSLGEAVTPGREFPTNRAYLYGSFFIEYLAITYGEQKLRDYLRRYSHELVGYFMQEGTAKAVFGKTFSQLWQEFLLYLQQRFSPQIHYLTDNQADIHTDIIAAEKTSPPVFSVNAKALFAVNTSRSQRTELIQYSASTLSSDVSESAEVLTHKKGIRYIDVSERGNILASRQLFYADGRAWNDLFLWNAQQGWQQLSERQRFRKARWLDDETVLASRNTHGISELVVLKLKKNDNQENKLVTPQVLWRGQPGEVLADFDVRDQRIIASLKQANQGWNLSIADMSASPLRWQAITDSKATENSPEFISDSEIIFSADYQGVFNIYQMNLTAPETLQQLTNTLTGAFNPSVINHTLYFSRYQHNGYQLVQQPLKSYAQLNAESVQGRYHFDYGVSRVTALNKSEPQSEPYQFNHSALLRSIRPHTWLPFYLSNDSSTKIGVITAGTDALGRQRYSALLNRDTQLEQWNTQLTYQYDNRWTVAFSRDHDSLNSVREENGRFIENVQRDDEWLIQRSLLAPMFEDQLTFYLGATIEQKQLVDTSIKRDEALLGGALRFDNREFFTDVPGTGWGTYVDLIYETNNVIQSDFSGDSWQARVNHSWDLPGRLSLSYDLAGGIADKGAESFSLGGESGDGGRLFGRNDYYLRGYENNVQRGHYIHRQTLSLGFPLYRLENNWGLNPFGALDIVGRTFVDSGQAWFRQQKRDQLTGIGAEITTELVLGYRAIVPFTLGYAQGLNDANGRTTQTYVSIGLFF